MLSKIFISCSPEFLNRNICLSNLKIKCKRWFKVVFNGRQLPNGWLDNCPRDIRYEFHFKQFFPMTELLECFKRFLKKFLKYGVIKTIFSRNNTQVTMHAQLKIKGVLFICLFVFNNQSRRKVTIPLYKP